MIASVEGDVKQLENQKLIKAEEDIKTGNVGDWGNTFTDTTLTFVTDENTVIVRWYGTSNGYYSESVDFAELGKKDNYFYTLPELAKLSVLAKERGYPGKIKTRDEELVFADWLEERDQIGLATHIRENESK